MKRIGIGSLSPRGYLRALFCVCLTVVAVGAAPIVGDALEQTGGTDLVDSSLSVDFDAVRGHQDIRTGPPVVQGVGYVHPVQMDIGPNGGSFVAVGTAKGAGTSDPNASHNCADDYDKGWTVYTDGRIGGIYFCYNEELDAYSAGDNPFFKISYGACPDGQNAWLLQFGSTLERCVFADQHLASSTTVMIETTGSSTVDRKIDVKYTQLQDSRSSSGFVDWDGSSGLFEAPSYMATQPNATSVNAYLAPLD